MNIPADKHVPSVVPGLSAIGLLDAPARDMSVAHRLDHGMVVEGHGDTIAVDRLYGVVDGTRMLFEGDSVIHPDIELALKG